MNILFWNIENFAFNKITDVDIAGVIDAVLFPPALGGAAVADIIVVIEVYARFRAMGDVPIGSGALGLDALRNHIVGNLAGYRCIPPISVAAGGGKAEAIGVIYDSATLNFQGPMVWSNYGPVPAAEIGHNQGNATPPWDDLLGPFPDQFNAVAYPAPWNVAPFAGVGALAPQVDYPNAAGNAFIEFPAAGYRRPLRCQFNYLNAGVLCGLDLWIVHLPPQVLSAAFAMVQLATVPAIMAAPAANSIRVVCGDFNLDTGNAWQLGLFGPMTGLGYTLQIGGGGGGPLPAGTATHFPNPTNYNTYLQGLSIDNALTWCGAGMAVAARTVIDMVAGTPAPTFASQLFNPLATYPAMWLPTQVFRAWTNFGHIGNRPSTGNMIGRHGASDHMPVYLQF